MRIDTLSRARGARVPLAAPADLDEQFNAWLAEACQVGELPCPRMK